MQRSFVSVQAKQGYTVEYVVLRITDCTEEGLRTETSIHDDDAVYMLKTDRTDSRRGLSI